MIDEIKSHHHDQDEAVIEAFLLEFKHASIQNKARMLKQLKEHSAKAELTRKERKSLKKVYRHELVKRSHLIKIAAAWVITVPASGIMAALIYFVLSGIM